MSHAELVERAGRWLRNGCQVGGRQEAMRCGVVVTELVTTAPETPDAIGFTDGGRTTVLIEAKTSRADFLADSNKHFRRVPKFGMGEFRYYLAPPGLIDVSELPDRWGLLEFDRRVRIVKLAEQQEECSRRYETAVLYSIARRATQNGTIAETREIDDSAESS